VEQQLVRGNPVKPTVPDSKEWNKILNFSPLRLRCMNGWRIFNACHVE
jgi:hypothetical protein